MQVVRRIEHALTRWDTRGAPPLTHPLAALGADLIRARARVVHAVAIRHTRTAEVETGSGTPRQAREVLRHARVIGAGERRTANILEHAWSTGTGSGPTPGLGHRRRSRAAVRWLFHLWRIATGCRQEHEGDHDTHEQRYSAAGLRMPGPADLGVASRPWFAARCSLPSRRVEARRACPSTRAAIHSARVPASPPGRARRSKSMIPPR